MPFEPQVWTELWGDTFGAVLLWLPNLAAALLILIVGWLVARLVQFILVNLLRRLRLDRLSERVGISRVMSNAGLDSSVSNLLARLTYWLMLFVFILAAAESLGLIGIVDTLDNLVSYLPHVLAAALILLFGSLLAQLAGDAVRGMSVQAGIASGPALGQVVRYTMMVIAIILALDQLGIQTNLLTIIASALVIAIALALAIAFGLGSRDLARNIMAGYHVNDSFTEGQQVRVRGHAGRLVSIGTVKSVIQTADGLVSLPNSALTEEEVTVLMAGEVE